MSKLHLVPLLASYVHRPGMGAVQIALDGGASRARADILNPASRVSVTFEVDQIGHEYFWAFHDTTIHAGVDSFDIDLIIDKAPLTQHSAMLVAGSISEKLTEGTYEITAELEVTRNAIDDEFNAGVVALVEAFGANEAAIFAGLASLEALVNVDLPAISP